LLSSSMSKKAAPFQVRLAAKLQRRSGGFWHSALKSLMISKDMLGRLQNIARSWVSCIETSKSRRSSEFCQQQLPHEFFSWGVNSS
jgi:hypothetical protein